MSFISVLKSIGHVVKTGVTDIAPFAPVIAAIPVAGAPIAAVLGAVAAAENLIPGNSTGTAKKSVATTVVNATTPGLNQQQLSSAIDQVVAALNAIAAAEKLLQTPANPAT